ncbi:HAD hydrolase-like protein [Bacillaceae bacterium SIJ1]|uniref:HAD family hydrolase n=1 Tax=Litoribacterium kuwaitense TaxID=1398745 RepID=UPI0013EC5288|nr:HAD family hydrolase [Litoribacterium kuwaitense]NGP44676.1 HAD hydrolase-like protein [Litoribacterium kuwaitense]
MAKLILFDVDGVLLSEERYFDASALTVWELLTSDKYLGLDGEAFSPAPSEEDIRAIRKTVFHDDEVLSFIKGRGINANWDMVYLTFSHQMLRVLAEIVKEDRTFVEDFLKEDITYEKLGMLREKAEGLSFTPDYATFVPDFSASTAEKQAILLYLNDIAWNALQIETNVFSRSSVLWDVCQEAFQEWYLGDALVEKSIGKAPRQTGKKGFLEDEIPIVEPKKMAGVLQELKNKGFTLGIGTGRPTIETLVPLEALGLLSYFDKDRIVSASDVLDAERLYPTKAPLAKPQPYCYVQGWLTKDVPVEEAINHPLPLSKKGEVYVVGDSLADYMAAKTMDVTFVATLTGLSGQKARASFEERNADYILNDASEILSIFAD